MGSDLSLALAERLQHPAHHAAARCVGLEQWRSIDVIGRLIGNADNSSAIASARIPIAS